MQGNFFFLYKSELIGTDLLSAFNADPNEGGGKHGGGETHESASLFHEARLVKYENHGWNVVKKNTLMVFFPTELLQLTYNLAYMVHFLRHRLNLAIT